MWYGLKDTCAPRLRYNRGALRGSGGRIRTSDLWVMSPTSCHCSTPRWAGSTSPASLAWGRWGPVRCRSDGARDGLASQGVAPSVLSGAAAGHDRVRDGTGWSHRARDHERRPTCPAAADPGPLASRARTRDRRSRTRVSPRPTGAAPRARTQRRRRAHHEALRRGPTHRAIPWHDQTRPLTISMHLGSGRLPAVHLVPVNPVVFRGSLRPCGPGASRLGAGFPLRCLQRFAHPDVATQQCRCPDNWLTSGPSIPVLSY